MPKITFNKIKRLPKKKANQEHRTFVVYLPMALAKRLLARVKRKQYLKNPPERTLENLQQKPYTQNQFFVESVTEFLSKWEEEDTPEENRLEYKLANELLQISNKLKAAYEQIEYLTEEMAMLKNERKLSEEENPCPITPYQP